MTREYITGTSTLIFMVASDFTVAIFQRSERQNQAIPLIRIIACTNVSISERPIGQARVGYIPVSPRKTDVMVALVM